MNEFVYLILSCTVSTMAFLDSNIWSLHKIWWIMITAKFDFMFLVGANWFFTFELFHSNLSLALIQGSFEWLQLFFSTSNKFWLIFVTPTLWYRERCLNDFNRYISLKLLQWIVNELFFSLSTPFYSHDCKIEVKPQISRSIFLTRVHSVFLGFSLEIRVSSLDHDAKFY